MHSDFFLACDLIAGEVPMGVFSIHGLSGPMIAKPGRMDYDSLRNTTATV